MKPLLLLLASAVLLNAQVKSQNEPANGAAAAAQKAAADKIIDERYLAVLALKPVGYWPADEGSGETLNDRSGNKNHGRIFHVPWDKGLLDFTGAYQWAEIPASTKYQSKSLTIGGWVFIRSKVEGSDSTGRMGMLLIGNKDGVNAVGVQLCVRRQELIDVVSKGKSDVFRTWLWSTEKRLGEGKPSLSLGEWHHLLYTFEATRWDDAADLHGKGSLYLDGHLLATNEDIPYKSENRSLQIGNDAYWWHQMTGKSGSLDGSVRDMVWFDRALSAEEVARLHAVTRPSAQPRFYGEDMVVLNGRGIAAGDLKDLPAPQRRAALQLFGKKDAATLQPLSKSLLPVQIKALQEADCRMLAEQLLAKPN
ncbi:MAG: LamG-like jellyroll fold domain-containing protein, partial [Verrucomicrobiales bacterium]